MARRADRVERHAPDIRNLLISEQNERRIQKALSASSFDILARKFAPVAIPSHRSRSLPFSKRE
jgi:hypothetical protein